MEFYHMFLCFVLFMSAVCLNTLDAVPEHAKDSLTLNTNSQNCTCENGKCVSDKMGHLRCVCRPGYAHQGEFNCKPCDCGSLGKCIFVLKEIGGDKYQYEKKCVCDVGKAEKDGVCVDCDCGENSACDFEFGERRCYCIEGHSEKDGVCTKCDCGFNGECVYENGIKKCKCDEGYLELNGICEECDCGNHGTCLFEKGQKTCKCQPGFDLKDGKCGSCDCGSNSVKCVFEGGIKRCMCKDRYADRYGTCEECYCGDYSMGCNFNNNQKTCNCLEGYVQKGETCEPGCSAKRPCQNGGYCKGGFCFCLKGTRGEFCEVIDECSNLCPNQRDTKCSYDVASQTAYCRCLDNNLKYDPKTKKCRRTCKDDTSCQNQGKCVGTSNLKFCDCAEGTAGDFCEEIPVCRGVICGSGAHCVFNPSTKKAGCACTNPKHKYDSIAGGCRLMCDTNNDCVNGGICGRNKYCYCLAGTRGDRCHIVDDCHFGRIRCCGSNVYCAFDLTIRRATCKCKNYNEVYDFALGRCRGFCTKHTDCFNGATCGYGGYCYCLPGTQGPRCEIINDCYFGRIRCYGGPACCAFNLATLRGICLC